MERRGIGEGPILNRTGDGTVDEVTGRKSKSPGLSLPLAGDAGHSRASFSFPRTRVRATDLREPSRLLLQIKAEAGICSVFKSSSGTEVRVGLAGGAGKQQAGVAHHTLPSVCHRSPLR